MLTAVMEIILDEDLEYIRETDIYVCDGCREKYNHTVVPVPDHKEGTCEFSGHVE